MRYEAAGRSDTGRQREENQDNLALHWAPVAGAEDVTPVGIFAVADGVGGRSHGEVASAMFCDEVVRRASELSDFGTYRAERDRELRKKLLRLLDRLVAFVGAEIYRRSESVDHLSGMSTTGITLLAADTGVFLAHVGDSRAYLIRGGKIYRLTEDHTVAMQLLKEGMIRPDEVVDHVFAHVLTRAFGATPHVDVDTLFVRAEPGDRFVLCTDGLHNYFGGADILRFSARFPDRQQLIDELIAEANARGGEDNITALVVDAVPADDEPSAEPTIELDVRLGFLRSLFLFHELNDQEIMRVMRITHQRTLRAGERVIRDGAVGRDFYVVLDGRAAVHKGGKELTTIGPGGHFGELALLGDHPRSADVSALTDMTLLTIERADLLYLLEDELLIGNKLLMSFLRNMSYRVRDLTERVDRGD